MLGWGAALVYYDITQLRLPNWLTVPAACLALAVCAVAPQGLWGLVWPVAYLACGRGVGGGDVKLALPLGVGCALLAGALSVLLGIAVAGGLTLLAAAALRRRSIAHGPSMLAAASLVALYGTLGESL